MSTRPSLANQLTSVTDWNLATTGLRVRRCREDDGGHLAQLRGLGRGYDKALHSQTAGGNTLLGEIMSDAGRMHAASRIPSTHSQAFETIVQGRVVKYSAIMVDGLVRIGRVIVP
jgi:hypothetical protein